MHAAEMPGDGNQTGASHAGTVALRSCERRSRPREDNVDRTAPTVVLRAVLCLPSLRSTPAAVVSLLAGRRVDATLGDCVDALTAVTASVVAVEDIQWADELTLAAIERCAATRPMILTVRPEADAGTSGDCRPDAPGRVRQRRVVADGARATTTYWIARPRRPDPTSRATLGAIRASCGGCSATNPNTPSTSRPVPIAVANMLCGPSPRSSSPEHSGRCMATTREELLALGLVSPSRSDDSTRVTLRHRALGRYSLSKEPDVLRGSVTIDRPCAEILIDALSALEAGCTDRIEATIDAIAMAAAEHPAGYTADACIAAASLSTAATRRHASPRTGRSPSGRTRVALGRTLRRRGPDRIGRHRTARSAAAIVPN